MAMELLALLVHESDFDTGEIKRSRPALAAELGVSPKVVSELMGELFKLGAVERFTTMARAIGCARFGIF